MLFIIKTRTLALYLIATLIFSPIVDKNTKKTKKLFFFMLFCSILLFAYFSDFIPYLDSIVKNDVGIQVRFSAIDHYWHYFLENPITGVGYISSKASRPLYFLSSGPLGQYNTSDVGLIGLFFKNGVIGVLWLFVWYVKLIVIIRKNNNIPYSYKYLMINLCIFVILSTVNLIVTDNNRFPYISLIMIIFEGSFILNDKRKNYGGGS